MAKKTLRAQCLEAIQRLVRMKAANDEGMVNCVSCNAYLHWKEAQGGHYIAKGSSSYWALEEENVHPQCVGCNIFGMSRGSAEGQYTLWMIDYYGKEFVENMHRDKRKLRKLYAADYRELLESMKNQMKIEEERLR